MWTIGMALLAAILLITLELAGWLRAVDGLREWWRGAAM
jgi:hypothetical protein